MSNFGREDDHNPPCSVSSYGAHGWTTQNYGASTSQSSQNRRPSTTQSSQNTGIPSSQATSASQSRNQGISWSQASTSTPNQPSASQASRDPAAPGQGSRNEARTNTDRQQQIEHLTTASRFLEQQIQEHAAGKSSGGEQHLAELTQGMNFIRQELQVLAATEPKTVKGEDKKQKRKEGPKCKICNNGKVYANSTTLFRHYRSMHGVLDPDERFGYTLNETVLNIDESLTQDHRCGICGYVTARKEALDAHTYNVHRNDFDKCQLCGYNASNQDDLVNHRKTHDNNNSGRVNNNDGIEAAKDKMHKCEECDCYYADKSKFDEHMKAMHGFDVLCQICKKNFRYKDLDSHFRDCHPDEYRVKETVEIKGDETAETTLRTGSGRRTRTIFKCSKCNEKFGSKKEASRHGRIHKREFRSRAASNSRASNQNCDVQTENNIIYVCEACNTATASYDVVVEHSQKHIVHPDEKFTTNGCDICELNFEPLCYEKHINVHYLNKDLKKDSFKYLKYNYQLLLTSGWLNFFDMEKEVVDRIISRSIYAETRGIKIKILSGHLHTNTLYKCEQCDNFIEPSTVTHHALNFDTCARIRHHVTCTVCERSFNTTLARDVHETLCTGKECFRIVTFNDENDREFNHILNNNEPGVISQAAANNDEENNVVEKVIYKCLCGLCFVFEDSANIHVKICPGKEQKQICQKCNNLFNLHELIEHCYQHHLNANIRLITKDIVPDVIEVSDDEIINEVANAVDIVSSDDEDDNDEAKRSQNGDVRVHDGKNEPQTSAIENVIQKNVSTEESDVQADLPVADTARDVPMNEDTDEYDDYNQSTSDERSDKLSSKSSDDEDSRNTLTDDKNHTTPNRSEIKCPNTNLEVESYYVRNRSENNKVIDDRNNNLALDTETTRLKIEAAVESIKKEIMDEDTDITMDRRAVSKWSHVSRFDSVIIDKIEIMTDDEDEEIAPAYERTEHANTNNVTDANVNPEEIIEDSNDTVAYSIQSSLRGIISYSSTTSDVIDERDIHSDDTMCII